MAINVSKPPLKLSESFSSYKSLGINEFQDEFHSEVHSKNDEQEKQLIHL